MPAPIPDVDPTAASSAAQYVALLRQVRDQSGLAYRVIARRARANGDVLPASTLATMFGRATLPRRELVVALLRACDVPATRMTTWLTAWQRLAADRDVRPNPLRLLPPAESAALVDSPPRVAGGVPFQLPPPPMVIVGRGDETRRLLGTMGGDGAVCLVAGAGGVGKSALVLHLAHRVAARYPGGCLYVDLHGASAGIAPTEPAEVLARFLRALGAPTVPPSVEEASTLLRTMTAAGGVLMVLDNAASAAQVRPLLLSGAGCTTVVTSRWMLLDLDATARISLDPLPDGVALDLLRRIGGARLDAEPAAAATIVRRCGGLPLALRIVGARAAARPNASLVGLADRIDDEHRRLDVFEAGDLSVRASLHLGYRAFDESEQHERRLAAHLFRLASLPDWSDASAPAVAALVDLPLPQVERMLEQLLDAHLLEPSGDVRYGFHDIVRLFARERAEAVEPPPVRAAALARLTGYLFTTTMSAARLLHPYDRFPDRDPARPDGPGHPLDGTADAWAWFEREHTNLLVVARQRLAAGHDPAEVRDLVLVVIEFLHHAGYVTEQVRFGDLGGEAARARQALAVCREFDHRRGMGLAQQVLGDVHAALGRNGDAERVDGAARDRTAS
ncbi:hypothetical protein AB0J90_24765 [Micromonospora sp. NPDC049523]|uniref:hypothetical protein n=1 Tax=Micromonospora sp. NPDC049523 TaxID=3155921 RepID=UPI0034241F74